MAQGLCLLLPRQRLQMPREKAIGQPDRENQELLSQDRKGQRNDEPPGRAGPVDQLDGGARRIVHTHAGRLPVTG